MEGKRTSVTEAKKEDHFKKKGEAAVSIAAEKPRRMRTEKRPLSL